MKSLRHGGLILAQVLAISGTLALSAADLPELKVGEEYDILLEDGEELTRAVVTETSTEFVVVEMKGLNKSIKVPRSAIRAAMLLEKRKLIKRTDIGLFGDFQFSLADLRLLNWYAPGAAMIFNMELGKKFPLLRFNAFASEVNFAYVTDGERQIIAGGLAFSPRWYMRLLRIDWFAGLGGGVSALYLKSYTFERWSYVPLAFIETGAFRDLNSHLRLYFSIRGNYYLDSVSALASVGLRLGLSFQL